MSSADAFEAMALLFGAVCPGPDAQLPSPGSIPRSAPARPAADTAPPGRKPPPPPHFVPRS